MDTWKKENPPKTKKLFLAYIETNILTVFDLIYFNEATELYHNYYGNRYNKSDITHWMLIPELS